MRAKEEGYTKTKYMATIYDGHSYIERRVFEKDFGWYVRINGFFVDIGFLITYNHFKVDTWYDG